MGLVARPGAVRVSAVTKAGLSQLGDTVLRRLIPHPPVPGEAVPISDAALAILDEMQTRFAV